MSNTNFILHPSFNRVLECKVIKTENGKTLVEPFTRDRRPGASHWANNSVIRPYKQIWVESEKVKATANEVFA